MKVGDLVKVLETLDPAGRGYAKFEYKGQLAVVIGIDTVYNETKVKLASDGEELWFLTTELEAV
tara:strand:+ start:1251 stop:1442 length:192 start_codon:yes stop_codon:yes gene_type:complete